MTWGTCKCCGGICWGGWGGKELATEFGGKGLEIEVGGPPGGPCGGPYGPVPFWGSTGNR